MEIAFCFLNRFVENIFYKPIFAQCHSDTMNRKTQRTPPTSDRKPQSREISAPDHGIAETADNITIRGKRQRPSDSPISQNSDHDMTDYECFKKDLMQMLNNWKADQDQRFNTWKSEQDAILSSLVRDVAELKTQCQQIQKSNLEIERGMEYINSNYEDVNSKLCKFRKRKTNLYSKN